MTPTGSRGPSTHLALLARAVSGTMIALTSTTEARAFVDGSTIAVPVETTDLADRVAVQAALIALGSLMDGQVRELARCDTATVERYLILEAARAAADPFLLPPRVATRIRSLGVPPAGIDPAESLRVARGRGPLPEAPAWMGTIKPRLLRKRPALVAEAGDDPPSELRLQAAHEDGTEDSDSERSRILELLTAPLGSQALSRALAKLLGLQGRDTDGEGGGDGAGDRVRRARRGRGRPAGAEVALPTAAGAASAGVRYPEWNCDGGAYRDEWCAVHVLDPALRQDTAALVTPVDLALRRELSRLGTAYERHRRLRDGDVINTCDAIEHEIARRLGRVEEPRVFEMRSRTARDLAVLVLLDATDSTGGDAAGASNAGSSLFDEQRMLAHRLTVALEELGDRVATYAFNSFGRNQVRFLRVKDFDGRYDEPARRRLAAVGPVDYTRLGAAVRHATHVLGRDAGTTHLLLVVVGDGFPYDEGYEDRYAREDSRVALHEALDQGIGCVSISIGHPSHVAHSVWSDVTHLVLKDQAELDQRARHAFGAALQLAVARRRAPGATTTGGARRTARSA